MKKTIGLILALLFVLSVAGCGSKKSDEETSTQQTVETTEQNTEKEKSDILGAAGEGVQKAEPQSEPLYFADSTEEQSNVAEEPLTNEYGQRVNEAGHPVDVDGRPINEDGYLVDENDDLILDDAGRPIMGNLPPEEPAKEPETVDPGQQSGTNNPENDEKPSKETPSKNAEAPTTEPQKQGDGSFSSFLKKNITLLFILASALLVILLALVIYLLRTRSKPDAPQNPLFRQNPPVHLPVDMPAQNAIPNSGMQPEMIQNIQGDTMRQTISTIEPAPGAPVRIARVHNVGKRKNQEDSFGISDTNDASLCRNKGVMAVVADGMGGLKGGEDVSSIAVLGMLQGFAGAKTASSDPEELEIHLQDVVRSANAHLSRTVGLKKGGSTLMAVIIHDRMLSWISVGDSRTALFRGGRLTDLNQRHTFAMELDEMVRQNRISPQQAASHPDRDKLTSYIGMGELKHVDRCVRPMQLNVGDKVILMSDGIFNTLTDPEIESILSLPTDRIADQLESAVLQKNNPYQDNFTAVVLEITQG